MVPVQPASGIAAVLNDAVPMMLHSMATYVGPPCRVPTAPPPYLLKKAAKILYGAPGGSSSVGYLYDYGPIQMEDGAFYAVVVNSTASAKDEMTRTRAEAYVRTAVLGEGTEGGITGRQVEHQCHLVRYSTVCNEA